MSVSPPFPQPTCDECRQSPGYHAINRTVWNHAISHKRMKPHGFRIHFGIGVK